MFYDKNFVTITIIVVLLIAGLFFAKNYKKNLVNMDKINMAKNISDSLKITSSAFSDNSLIPAKYTCDGENINPPLEISGVPESAKSLALIVDDPDAPVGLWIHWVAWNINPKTKSIPEGIQSVGVNGLNTRGKAGYDGPCPPDKEHRYFFKIFALDTQLDIPQKGTADDLLKAMDGHIVEKAELIGRYNRKR